MAHMSSRTTGCLFCGNDDGRFDSEEHIIPLALGNSVRSGLVTEEFVLPPGDVCDKCNGRRLSRRDAALAAWPPISVFRSLALIVNRRGRLVDAVDRTRWDVRLDPDDPCAFELLAEASTNLSSGRDDVARAMCKIALETLCLQDPAEARGSRWDAVAAAAIGGPLPEGLALGLTQPTDPRELDPTPSSRVLVGDGPGPLQMACELWVVGLRLLVVLGGDPPTLPHTTWWVLDPRTGVLAGPDSMWARFSATAQRAQRITDDPSPEPTGRSSRLPTHRDNAEIRIARSSAAT